MPLTPNNEFIDNVMGQIVPTGATPGALYATDITQDLLINVAQHTHTGASNLDGYQLGADSLVIASDLQLNNNNLGTSRSIEFVSQSTNINGPDDVDALYVVDGDLWFNDGFGNQIRVTESGAIIPSTIASLLNWTTATITGTGSPISIPSNSVYNCYNCTTTTATLPIILPMIATLTAGRFFIFKDIGDNAANNNITINVATGSTDLFDTGQTSFTIDTNGGYIAIYCVQSVSPNVWEFYTQSVYNNQTLQLDNASNLNVNNSQLTLNGSSAFTVNSGGGVFYNSAFVDTQTTTFIGNGNNTSDSGSSFALSGATITESGGTHTFESGSVLTLQAATDAYFQGPIVLGNLTSIPLPYLPSTPKLYVNNGGIILFTSNALEVETAQGIAVSATGGIRTLVDNAITLGGDNNDNITFINPKTKTVVYNLQPVVLLSTSNASSRYGTINPYTTFAGYGWTILPGTASLVLTSPWLADVSNDFGSNLGPVTCTLPPLQQGASIASAVLFLQLRIPSSRSPSTNLSVSLVATNISGVSTTLGTGTISGYTTAGVQPLSFSCSGSIDNTQNTYYVVIQDEYNTTPTGFGNVGGNYFISFQLNYSNITSYLV